MTAETVNEWVIRAPAMEDAPAVTDLVNLCSVADGDTPDLSLADVLSQWQAPGFNLATDAWLATTSDGQVVGCEEAGKEDDTHFQADGYVHPDYRGRGIGTTLLRLAEAWTRERVPAALGGRVVLRAGVSGKDAAAHQLFAAEGFTLVRNFWRMEIQMDEPPPPPVWAAGITVRIFMPGQDDRALYEAVQEAFADGWEHVPPPFEEWAHRRIWREDFDPTLCFLAMDGGAVAGAAICRDRMGAGWVTNLGVRRPWRQRGVGMALLRHAFGEFYRRGARTVGLGVDAQNPTGATRLYERVGMRVTQQYDMYEQALFSEAGAEPAPATAATRDEVTP
jgi:mycothiol synthase